MTHPIHHVASCSIVGPFTLAVTFVDRSRQVIDFRPVLRGDDWPTVRDSFIAKARSWTEALG